MIIRNELTYYNDSMDIVLTQTYADGHHHYWLFDSTSQVVNHLRDNGIDVALEDIHTV